MINAKAVASINELVTAAADHGATIATGGGSVDGPGHFYPPTVLGNVRSGDEITRHEIFGPVAPVITLRRHRPGDRRRERHRDGPHRATSTPATCGEDLR